MDPRPPNGYGRPNFRGKSGFRPSNNPGGRPVGHSPTKGPPSADGYQPGVNRSEPPYITGRPSMLDSFNGRGGPRVYSNYDRSAHPNPHRGPHHRPTDMPSRDYYHERAARIPPLPHKDERAFQYDRRRPHMLPPRHLEDHRYVPPRPYPRHPASLSSPNRSRPGRQRPHRGIPSYGTSMRPSMFNHTDRYKGAPRDYDESESVFVTDRTTNKSDSEGEIDETEVSVATSKDEDVEVDIADQESEDEKVSKDDIMSRMDKIDDEIGKFAAQLESLHKKSSEVELSDDEVPVLKVVKKKTSKRRSSKVPKSVEKDTAAVINRIYTENEEKLKKIKLKNLDFNMKELFDTYSIVPYPKEPKEYDFYHENLKKFANFKHSLAKYIDRNRAALAEKDTELRKEYDFMYEEWQAKIIKWEEEQMQKSFRSSRQNPSRGIQRRSIGEFGNDLDNNGGFDQYDYDAADDFRYLKTLAIIPPMLLDQRIREVYRYLDGNRTFEDSLHSIRLSNNENPWTEEEKKIFLKKYLDFPKEFGRIAAFLPNKTFQDCILFYYLNKKSLKLRSLTKQALALRNKRRRKMEPEIVMENEYTTGHIDKNAHSNTEDPNY